MVYEWNSQAGSVEVSPDVSLAEFYVVGFRQRRVLEVSITARRGSGSRVFIAELVRSLSSSQEYLLKDRKRTLP